MYHRVFDARRQRLVLESLEARQMFCLSSMEPVAHAALIAEALPDDSLLTTALPPEAAGPVLPEPAELLELSIVDRLKVKSADDVTRVRQELIDLIWSGAGLPYWGPNQVIHGIPNPMPFAIPAASIDKLVIEMDLGFTSQVTLYHPVRPNGDLVIWHQGHEVSQFEADGPVLVRELLGLGYTVMGFDMPGHGSNSSPVEDWHDGMGLLQTPQLHPLKFFLEPVAVALNHVKAQHVYNNISMTGISGGGWTTVLYSALDPTIRASFPVAGSLPEFLRTGNEIGDWEQQAPDVYAIAEYLDLYLLGSIGPGRSQLQINNLWDGCCFRGRRSDVYADTITEVAADLGGNFQVFIDETHEGHKISEYALTSKIVPGLAGLREASVFGRHLFYNNSRFDNVSLGGSDDLSIATDKTALLPGGTASFENYSSYSRGINGVMIDIVNLPGVPTADDFLLRVGNDADPDAWEPVSFVPQVSVRLGEGISGSDRVTLVFPDFEVIGTWLQITVKPSSRTGLASADVFYFGNAIGDTGNSEIDARVTIADEIQVRNNPYSDPASPASITNPRDFNRDGRVTVVDQVIARSNRTSLQRHLRLIDVDDTPTEALNDDTF